MRWTRTAADPGDPALPAGVEPLSKYIQAPPELARRLAQVGLVARADGARLAASLRTGQRLVSREGDLWRWDGFAADAHAPTGAARRLAQRARYAQIEAELKSAQAEVETRRLAVADAETEVTTAAAAQSDAHAAERELGRNAARISALVEANARLIASRDEASAARTAGEQALAALPPAAALESRLAAILAEITDRRSALAEVRAEAQAIAREAEIADRRLQAIATERQGWSERTQGAAAQIATIEARSREADAEREQLRDAPRAFADKRTSLIGEVAGAEAARRAAADALAAAETALAEADKAARIALEAVGEARTEAARAEERHEAAKRRLADIAREIRDMLEVEPAAVAELAEIKPGAEPPAVADVEERLERLRRERERLGAVNLRAEEELREIETQHANLARERDDLVEAIKRLRQGIQSLNREARERLLASFAVVNGHFEHLFTQLFGGGNAQLQLIESDDPLEAGLEIMAKPPGKKLTTLSLLSGGEQALTALALIFAVFLTNPAPICVLDEVDAPLDDHNVERFCDLLDEMTKSTDTRFVIITHNPITMARMNRLYGVTMAERGISQLVSVDLEGAVNMREAV
jgi:chromosome segregation protein